MAFSALIHSTHKNKGLCSSDPGHRQKWRKWPVSLRQNHRLPKTPFSPPWEKLINSLHTRGVYRRKSGVFQRAFNLILVQKHRDTNGSCIVIQIGGVHATFCQEEGVVLQKYHDRNGRCIAILFKNIGVRGRFDFPEKSKGYLQMLGNLLNVKGVVSRELRKSKLPRKSPEKRTLLSLAFYNAPSLPTVDLGCFELYIYIYMLESY